MKKLKLSGLVQSYGQLMLAQHVHERETARAALAKNLVLADGGAQVLPPDVFEQYGGEVLRAVVQVLEAREANEVDARAQFIAHTAVELLRSDFSELNAHEVDRAVELATRLVQQSVVAAAGH